jgi:hypothetical protein
MPTVFQSQLIETETLLRSRLTTNFSSRFKNTVWSTGYNGPNEAGWDEYWKGSYDKETEEGQQIIRDLYGKANVPLSPILLFGLLLMSRQATKDERPPPPDFKEFMLPFCRTVTFGTLGELNRVHGARYGEHNLSGWFGRSGSMICAVRKPGTFVVFGICKSTIIARVLSSSLP